MIKGLSKQVVHPMDGDKTLMIDGEEDDSQRCTDSSSEAGTSATETTKVFEISSDLPSSSATVNPETSTRESNRNDSSLKSTSAYNNEGPHTKQKTGRKLTFADENGGDLVEINYSSRTHYSKTTATSASIVVGKDCCIIM
jgi:hypothetical protein